MKHFRAKMSLLPLHYKILMWFVLFSLIMMILLWFFQTVFFSTFYRNVRVNQVKDCAKSIENNITESNITSLVENVAEQNDVLIYVYDTSSSVLNPLYSTDKSFMRIAVYTEIDSLENSSESNNTDGENSKSNDKTDKDNTSNSSKNKSDSSSDEKRQDILTFSDNQLIKGNSAYTYYEDAAENGNSCVTFIDGEEQEEQEKENLLNSFRGGTPPLDKLNTQSMVYTSLFSDSEDNDYMLIITSQISPVDSVESTIRYQLIFITLVLIAIGIFIAVLASRKISNPITATTRAARQLANKNYDIEFNSTGYLEVTELNNTLNYAAGELKKVDALQRELIANISHDLRTPLTMITGYGEVMRDLPGENTPENIQIIIDEANRLNMLVTDLLDISKLQSGTTPLSKEIFSLTTLILEMFQRYNKLKEQEGYNLIFEYDEEVFVNADISKINQVVYNLVNNAINYSGADKTIIVRQLVRDGKVTIEVEDHGDGIDQEHLENIWDRYYKVDKEHKSSVVGTGLGLSIVKNILALHNAYYGVRSIVGEGSVFWFELEVAEEEK